MKKLFARSVILGICFFARTASADCDDLTKDAKSLFTAISSNDLTKVQKLAPKVKLNGSYRLRGGDVCDVQFLAYAIRSLTDSRPARLEIVKALLKRGAAPNTAGLSPYRWSRKTEDLIELVQLLVAAGFDLNANYSDREDRYGSRSTTLLVKWSAKADFPDLIKYLVSAGANVNAPDSDGRTPLTVAVSRCAAVSKTEPLSTIQMLISLGAQLDSSVPHQLPLSNAIASGCVENAAVLLNAGADGSLLKSARPDSIFWFLVTTLKAAVAGRIQTGEVLRGVQLLHSLGLEVNGKDSPLILAASYPFPEVLSLLTAMGAAVNPVPDWSGRTPLTAAAESNYDSDENIRVLLSAGADMNYRLYGNTALHLSASKGHAGQVKVLLEAGLNVNLLSDQGLTPLVSAIKGLCLRQVVSAEPVVKLLLSRGADPKRSNALQWAIDQRCSKEVVREILMAGG